MNLNEHQYDLCIGPYQKGMHLQHTLHSQKSTGMFQAVYISERDETFPYHQVSSHALHTGRFHGSVSARTSTGCVRPGYISLLQHVLATS